jgi:HD superfamily phosphohydrolase
MGDYFVGSQGIEFPGRHFQSSKCASKIVMDPIHGLMKLDGIFAEVVDTPQFQRLRDLKQLGSAYFIFPGASHNRFEHSLGVAHLSKIWANKFRTDQPELGCTERQVDLVGLAGLCHDLGHGPFSHVFDNEFIPAVKPHTSWKHEEMSVKLLDHCIDMNSIDLGDCAFSHCIILVSLAASLQTKKMSNLSVI